MTFEEWWATKEAEGYQYGRGPLATVRFGFEAGHREAFSEAVAIAQSALGDTDIWGAYGGHAKQVIVTALEAARDAAPTDAKNSDLETQAPEGWEWVRGKITKCVPWLAADARSDSLKGTPYEVMGWLHVLCAQETAARVTYVQIAIEQQKRAEIAEAKSAQPVRLIKDKIAALKLSVKGQPDEYYHARQCQILVLEELLYQLEEKTKDE